MLNPKHTAPGGTAGMHGDVANRGQENRFRTRRITLLSKGEQEGKQISKDLVLLRSTFSGIKVKSGLSSKPKTYYKGSVSIKNTNRLTLPGAKFKIIKNKLKHRNTSIKYNRCYKTLNLQLNKKTKMQVPVQNMVPPPPDDARYSEYGVKINNINKLFLNLLTNIIVKKVFATEEHREKFINSNRNKEIFGEEAVIKTTEGKKYEALILGIDTKIKFSRRYYKENGKRAN